MFYSANTHCRYPSGNILSCLCDEAVALLEGHESLGKLLTEARFRASASVRQAYGTQVLMSLTAKILFSPLLRKKENLTATSNKLAE